MLDYIASLSNHTHPIVPILVDENIHKRCLKLLYSDRTQRWNFSVPVSKGTCTHFRNYATKHNATQRKAKHEKAKEERKPLNASFLSRGKARGTDLQAPDCLLLEPGY